jgi:hypothetical protein
MPPQVALLLCTVFVLLLLRIDRKQNPEVSFAFCFHHLDAFYSQ